MTRILFAGNHNIGYDALKLLLKDYHADVAGVLAHPPGGYLSGWFRDVAALGRSAKVPVLTPGALDDEAVAAIRDLAPDLIITVGYGKLLPPAVLSIPGKGAVGVHGSYLPDYRGRFSPVWAVMNGEERHGASLILLDADINTGEIIDQSGFPLLPEDTGYTAYQRTCAHMLGLLRRNLHYLVKGEFSHRPQPRKGDYYGALTDDDRRIDWPQSAERIVSRVRACYFPPYEPAYTLLDGARYRVQRAQKVIAGAKGEPGTVVYITAAREPIVMTGSGPVLLTESDLIGELRGHVLGV